MAVNAKSLVKRNDKLKEDRMLWDGFYRDVVDYFRPRKQTADEHRVPGTVRHKHYDSTAPHASNTLALIMADTLTPKAIQWFGFNAEQVDDLPALAPACPVQHDTHVDVRGLVGLAPGVGAEQVQLEQGAAPTLAQRSRQGLQGRRYGR